MELRRNNNNSERIKRFKLNIIIGFVLIIISVTFIISLLTINKTDDVLKEKVSSMTAELNVQMKINIDSYLSKMETTGTLVFASEEVYKYNAVTAEDEYEALSTEKIISDKLFDLCIMENFVDFGIVYSNNHIVGKVSNGTTELFGERLYEDLSSMINRPRTCDGWFTGYKDNFKRIYYVKSINEDALLVISFYTTELEYVFEHPGEMDEMNIRLVENNHIVIYSSVDGETGKPLPEPIEQRINGRTSAAVMDDDYLVTINSCGDSWYVICSIPTHLIMKEKNEIRLYTILVGSLAAVIAAIMSIIFSLKITNPVNNIVTTLDNKAHIDQLTGILNKRSFEEYTENVLKQTDLSKHHAIILLDVDNFKGVNDTLGHTYGDKVLAEIGNILRTVFNSDDYLGRIGGDEFCVFLNIPDSRQNDYAEFIRTKCEDLCRAFHNNYTGDDNGYKISASIGAAVFSQHGTDFSQLYKCADLALYESKHKGKDTYTIFSS